MILVAMFSLAHDVSIMVYCVHEGGFSMNVIEAISSRRSIRQFTSQPISSEDLQTILAAGIGALDWI